MESVEKQSNRQKYEFETLFVSLVAPGVLHVELNRPKKLNAFNEQMWKDIGVCFSLINEDSSIRAVVLSGRGKLFTAGLDLRDAMKSLVGDEAHDTSRKAYYMRKFIMAFQASFTQVDNCRVPVISAIHSGCIGAGVDLICATDIRIASADSYFSVREVDVGLAADIGTLQRGQKVVGNSSFFRTWAYTGENVSAQTALTAGLISKVLKDKDECLKEAIHLAVTIASKSPVAVVGTKHILNYSRDHPIQNGLDYTATWNMSMLQSQDLIESFSAQLEKRPAHFSNL